MGNIFIGINHFFERWRILFIVFLLGILVFSILGLNKIQWNSDVLSILPQAHQNENYNTQLTEIKHNNQILILIHTDQRNDTTLNHLLSGGEWWEKKLFETPYLLSSIQNKYLRIGDELQKMIFDSIFYELPYLLDASDYGKMSAKLDSTGITDVIKNNIRRGNSLSGNITKHYDDLDPLHFNILVLDKIKSFQVYPKLHQVNGFQVSNDEKNLLLFIKPVYEDNSSLEMSTFLDSLQSIKNKFQVSYPHLKVYFAGAPVSTRNNQQQSTFDGISTGMVAFILTLILIFYFFRSKRLSLISIIPSSLGFLIALSTMGWMGTPIVLLALSAGPIILVMGINYAIHLIESYKVSLTIPKSIENITRPMIVGNITTVAAFGLLCTSDSLLLSQFGLLSVISILVDMLATLMILPHFLPKQLPEKFRYEKIKWLDRFSRIEWHRKKWILPIIFLGTIILIPFSLKIEFSKNPQALSFESDEDITVSNILKDELGINLSDKTLRINAPTIDSAISTFTKERTKILAENNKIIIPNVGSIIPDVNTRWLNFHEFTKFWNPSRIKNYYTHLSTLQDSRQKNNAIQFLQYIESIDTNSINENSSVFLKNHLLSGMMHNEEDMSLTIQTPTYYADSVNNEYLTTRQTFFNQMSEYIKIDFNDILIKSTFLIFIILLLFYGRIELTFLTILPLFISWVWILGIAYLFHLEFHIVNLILCTFIFGLCDDYSIFMVDGLTRQHTYGYSKINHEKKVIIISVVVTAIGLVALLFGKHPAFHSFAILALVGLIVVLFISLTIQPALYHFFVTSRTSKGFPPMTLLTFYSTFIVYLFFALFGLLNSFIGILLKWTRLLNIKSIKLLYHRLIVYSAESTKFFVPDYHQSEVNIKEIDFKNPGIIISNHQSHNDLLIFLGLNPQIIVLTNEWVYRNPIYGGLVRSAGFLPGFEGVDTILSDVKKSIQEGYSLLIFPEGTRSPDGKIYRFHKGAFLLAKELGLNIYPVLLHGMNRLLPKGDHQINPIAVTVKALPKITPDDVRFNLDYSKRTKEVTQYMRSEFKQLSKEIEDPTYNFPELCKNYLYKGPKIYWYARIKVQLEELYQPIHDLVPYQAKIIDFGCGYGMLPLMLKLCGPDREITGYDYDEEKINVAANCYSAKKLGINYHFGDMNNIEFESSDVFIMYDSLHYLTPEQQKKILNKCISKLNPSGKILIRENNNTVGTKARISRWTEWFSTIILRFNKTNNKLHFINDEFITEIAQQYQLSLEIIRKNDLTSNTLYVLNKPC